MNGHATAEVVPAWPLHSRIPLAALATAPACARGHVRAIAHWCTILMSVAVRLLMHPRCRQVIALLA